MTPFFCGVFCSAVFVVELLFLPGIRNNKNPDKKGNTRDYATINELICLSNMENINAVFIADGMAQSERLKKLNRIAISQMKVLNDVEGRKLLK